MTNILLSSESIDKTKAEDTFAFLITDVIIPDEMKRADVVDLLAAAGIYSSEDDVVYGKDVSDSRNERMVLKAVGHLGHSDHKYNLPALEQLATAWPSSRFTPIDLDSIGAYSYTTDGQLMANTSVLPFGGAQFSEVSYGAGINLISNMYTAERMEAFTRSLPYPTVVKIVEGLVATERLWLTKQSTLAGDTSLLEARRSLHSGRVTRSRSKVSAMESLMENPGELYQVSQIAFDFYDANGTLDVTTCPTDRAEKGSNRVRTALANAFKAESGVLAVLQRTSGIPAEWESLGKKVSDRLVCTPLAASDDVKEKMMGKFVAAPVRLVVVSKETAKMITECTIKTKLHVAACSGANASDSTDTMRPWGFDGYALEQLNNPVTSIEHIPHDIDDDIAVSEWMHALVGAAAADDTKITCHHRRWTKDGGGAIDVQLADDHGDSAVMWQVEEWIQDANGQTKQNVDPSGVIMHRTSVAHANPTPVKLKKAIVRTDGAGLKITNWCRTNRPGLPWFSATPAEATAPTEEGSNAVVKGGRHGSFGAFVAHTELAKKATTKTIEAQGGQITKLDEAVTKSQEMLQILMAAIGSNNKETKVLSGRVDGIEQKTDQIDQKTDRIDEKADRIIAALEKAGVAISPDAAAPTTAPVTTPAPPSDATKPAPNPWMAAPSGGGRGGGRKRDLKRNMGGTVSEDYDGLDDDDEDIPPIFAARTRGGIARRLGAVRLMLRGAGASDAPGATGTDARELVPGTELSWPERIKQLYGIGDGSDAHVAEVLDAIQRTEGELANAGIADMHF